MSDLYTFTIFPIELLYKYIYLALYLLIHDYGLALLALSLLNYFLLIPLNKLVRGIAESENQLQQILAPQLQKIKESSQAAERQQRIQNLYGRYSYHPIYALRNVFPLLIQLPFLMAVYFMVSALPELDSISFLFISNLAQPDGILWGINLMPIVMTIVSLVNACFIVKLSTAQKKQAVFVALVFLILLYNAPSALLVYWTMNNVLILAFGLLYHTSPVKSMVQCLSVAKEKCIPSLLDSSGLFLALCFSVPLCFTLSLNTNLFNEIQISSLLIFIITVCFGFLLSGVFLDKMIRLCSSYYASAKSPFIISIKNAPQCTSCRKLYIRDFVYILITLIAVCCATRLCISLGLYLEDRLSRIILHLVFIVLFFLIARKYSFKLINIALLTIFVFTCLQFAKNLEGNPGGDEIIQKSFNSFPLEEKLHTRPNIYVVLLESYMSPKTLRETYHYDNSSFENKLTDNGFKVYNQVYSNSSFTNGAILNLFMMQPDMSVLFQGLSDVSMTAHNIFGGSNNNLLYSYLKKNNYIISSYYNNQNYYFYNQGNLLDYTIQELDSSHLNILHNIAPNLSYVIRGSAHQSRIKNERDIYPLSFKHIQRINKFNQPSFFFMKPTNQLHLISRKGTVLGSSYKHWISSKIYQKGVELMNQELLQLIDEIEKNDSDALIVFVGDHGHKFLGAATGDYDIFNNGLNYIKGKYPRFNLSSEQIIEDFYSVFLAIKMPQSAKGTLKIDSYYSYADLFRHIFAALDDNPVFLENKSDDISVNIEGLILRKGDKIYDDGEKASSSKK